MEKKTDKNQKIPHCQEHNTKLCSPKIHVEAPTPGTSKYDFIWRQGLLKGD